METSFDPICPKTLCSLSPTPVMLHIKFDQNWPYGFRDIQVWKCGRRRTTDDDDDDDDGRRRTDDGPLVYYKLTLWAFGSGELIIGDICHVLTELTRIDFNDLSIENQTRILLDCSYLFDKHKGRSRIEFITKIEFQCKRLTFALHGMRHQSLCKLETRKRWGCQFHQDFINNHKEVTDWTA